MERTPGKWESVETPKSDVFNVAYIIGKRGEFIATVHAPIAPVVINEPEALANAEFIVKACNSHEELLKACEDAIITLSLSKILPSDIKLAKSFLNAAIAKATKEAKP